MPTENDIPAVGLGIDPTREASKDLIQQLISSYPDAVTFRANTPYMLQRAKDSKKEVYLKHHLFSYQNGSFWAVLNSQRFAYGASAEVWEELGHWSNSDDLHYFPNSGSVRWVTKEIDFRMGQMIMPSAIIEKHRLLALKEVQCTAALPYFNIQFDPVEYENKLSFRMRLLGDMDLSTLIEKIKENPGYLSTNQLLLIAYGLFSSLDSQAHEVAFVESFTEENTEEEYGGIVNADIKPDNFRVKLSVLQDTFMLDFGYSCSTRKLLGDIRGTPIYLDPAHCEDYVNKRKNMRKVDTVSDAYSLALTVAELLGDTSRDRLKDFSFEDFWFQDKNIDVKSLLQHVPDLRNEHKETIQKLLKDVTHTKRRKRLSHYEVMHQFRLILCERFQERAPYHSIFYSHYNELKARLLKFEKIMGKEFYPFVNGHRSSDVEKFLNAMIREVYKELLAIETLDELLSSEYKISFITEDLQKYLSNQLAQDNRLPPDIRLSRCLKDWRKSLFQKLAHSIRGTQQSEILDKEYLGILKDIREPLPINARMIRSPFERKRILDDLTLLCERYQILGNKRLEKICKNLMHKKDLQLPLQGIFQSEAAKILLTAFEKKLYPEKWQGSIRSVIQNIVHGTDPVMKKRAMRHYQLYCKLVEYIKSYSCLGIDRIEEISQKILRKYSPDHFTETTFYHEVKDCLEKPFLNISIPKVLQKRIDTLTSEIAQAEDLLQQQEAMKEYEKVYQFVCLQQAIPECPYFLDKSIPEISAMNIDYLSAELKDILQERLCDYLQSFLPNRQREQNPQFFDSYFFSCKLLFNEIPEIIEAMTYGADKATEKLLNVIARQKKIIYIQGQQQCFDTQYRKRRHFLTQLNKLYKTLADTCLSGHHENFEGRLSPSVSFV